MTTRGFVTALGVFALSAAWALPAIAQTYTATFTGTIDTSAADTANYFGGGNLEGDTITTTYTYSLTNGGDRDTVPGLIDRAYGGPGQGDGSTDPILSVSMTINGITQIFSGPTYGEVAICAASYCGGNVAVGALQNGPNIIQNLIVAINGNSLGLLYDLTAAQTSASTQIYTDTSYIDWGGDDFEFSDSSVTFNGEQVSPAPEPASLAAFGAGLLALGLIRGRKNTG